LGQKLNQCNINVENATIMCIEHVQNLATMDEEFQALVEYVEQAFCQSKHGLGCNMERKKAQKVE